MVATQHRVGLLVLGLTLAALAVPAGAGAAFAPLAQYGSLNSVPGDGAGELFSPDGIAADAAGGIYVAELGNDRVSQFAASGAFVQAWGFDVIPANFFTGLEACTAATSCQEGTSIEGHAGQLSSPRGIAADGDGSLYVLDGFGRVSVFTAAGAFVRAWGFDVIPGGPAGFEVCTAATTCQPSTVGGGAGQLSSPTGVAADGAGNVYVSDQGNQRVSQYTAGGAFVRAWGFDVIPGDPSGFEICTAATGCQQGTTGGAAGQLLFPSGIAADGAGNNLYVTDGNHRVSQFTTSGAFVRAWGFDVKPGSSGIFEICTEATGCKAGTPGAAAGQLASPADVAADGAGNVYVTGSNRVSQFTTSGAFVRAFGFDVIPGDPAAFEVCTAATTCKAGVAGGETGQLNAPRGVVTDCREAIYVVEEQNHRVQRFGEEGTPLPPCPPASSGAGPAAPTAAENPQCAQLRTKLKKAKKQDKRKKARKLRRKLRRLGC